jgi:hypothetical protein
VGVTELGADFDGFVEKVPRPLGVFVEEDQGIRRRGAANAEGTPAVRAT